LSGNTSMGTVGEGSNFTFIIPSTGSLKMCTKDPDYTKLTTTYSSETAVMDGTVLKVNDKKLNDLVCK